jgi:hypothetical protein
MPDGTSVIRRWRAATIGRLGQRIYSATIWSFGILGGRVVQVSENDTIVFVPNPMKRATVSANLMLSVRFAWTTNVKKMWGCVPCGIREVCATCRVRVVRS